MPLPRVRLLLALVAVAADAQVDFAGSYLDDDGGVATIEQTGNSVTATWNGFYPFNTYSGTVNDNTITLNGIYSDLTGTMSNGLLVWNNGYTWTLQVPCSTASDCTSGNCGSHGYCLDCSIEYTFQNRRRTDGADCPLGYVHEGYRRRYSSDGDVGCCDGTPCSTNSDCYDEQLTCAPNGYCEACSSMTTSVSCAQCAGSHTWTGSACQAFCELESVLGFYTAERAAAENDIIAAEESLEFIGQTELPRLRGMLAANTSWCEVENDMGCDRGLEDINAEIMRQDTLLLSQQSRLAFSYQQLSRISLLATMMSREPADRRRSSCNVDCLEDSWSQWSSCSAQCGGGIKLRTRTILTHPTYLGRSCGAIRETVLCNTMACEDICPSGYADITNGAYNFWACGSGCPGGSHTDDMCGCACKAPTPAPTFPTPAPSAPTPAPTIPTLATCATYLCPSGFTKQNLSSTNRTLSNCCQVSPIQLAPLPPPLTLSTLLLQPQRPLILSSLNFSTPIQSRQQAVIQLPMKPIGVLARSSDTTSENDCGCCTALVPQCGKCQAQCDEFAGLLSQELCEDDPSFIMFGETCASLGDLVKGLGYANCSQLDVIGVKQQDLNNLTSSCPLTCGVCQAPADFSGTWIRSSAKFVITQQKLSVTVAKSGGKTYTGIVIGNTMSIPAFGVDGSRSGNVITFTDGVKWFLETPSPTLSPTPSPTQTPSPTLSPTPSPTQTPRPTPSPTLSPTASPPQEVCFWTSVAASNCPCTSSDYSGCSELPNCTSSMGAGEFCEADSTLPDGNTAYEANNCPGNFDVFQYTCQVLQLQPLLTLHSPPLQALTYTPTHAPAPAPPAPSTGTGLVKAAVDRFSLCGVLKQYLSCNHYWMKVACALTCLHGRRLQSTTQALPYAAPNETDVPMASAMTAQPDLVGGSDETVS